MVKEENIMKTVKFSKRLPDILLESLFIVLALLGALAIDEWRDDKEKEELAIIAERAILDEMRSNGEILALNLERHKKLLGELETKLQQHKEGKDVFNEFSFNYSMVMLSQAAWDSSRMSQAVQYIPLSRITSYSNIHTFQEMFNKNQSGLIDSIMNMGNVDKEDYPKLAESLKHRLQLLVGINQDLQNGIEVTTEMYQNVVGAE